ncbi:hypothetical protein RAS12_19745 [Achromobacter seleniivolatilans]|uniref:Ig-like domain-containing protein n=1 Tax=Achromobacter seleniivolatilans TaxID=3047478 RepID=A0ABY9LW04_9BURK|nr:hypothetical protein [Achromobacter sp. R39]WMD18845.1 hypothetical protein RAS12_19745 [Achromobacter sp. R39]
MANRKFGQMRTTEKGNLMGLISWVAAAFILALPSSYQLESQRIEQVPGPGGIGSTIETECVWKNDQGETVMFSWWNPFPPRPGEPMVAARETQGVWAGESASFVETKIYNGAASRVAVAYQQRPSLQAQTRIVATGLELDELQALLKASTLKDMTADAASKAGCGAIPPK